MGFIRKLFSQRAPEATISSQDYITKAAGGANLVDGKPTWHFAKEKKDDLNYMTRCADAELATMKATGLPAAPYYFERVAILLRKNKQYGEELQYCERYIHLVEQFYAGQDTSKMADIRQGPRYKAITARVPRAKALLETSISKNKPSS